MKGKSDILMPKATMLTTKDNPFDPFDQWDDWLRYDEDKGYFTCQYLARMADISSELSEADQELNILTAMYEIIKFQPDTYKTVTKDVDA